MATITDNKNGSLMLLLDPVEQDTVAGLSAGQLQAYVTLWLQERATQVFQQQFAKLSPQDQADVLLKFRDAGKG
jgi:hypothetical protein